MNNTQSLETTVLESIESKIETKGISINEFSLIGVQSALRASLEVPSTTDLTKPPSAYVTQRLEAVQTRQPLVAINTSDLGFNDYKNRIVDIRDDSEIENALDLFRTQEMPAISETINSNENETLELVDVNAILASLDAFEYEQFNKLYR